MFYVAQAVYYLHRFGIIHGDLKGGNVLYFSDDDIRLIDFNLSTKMWSPKDKFNHVVGTYSHSPPEALVGGTWGMSLDIWALGCLFYEVTFGKLLIPHQGSTKLSNGKRDRKESRLRYYRSLSSWLNEDSYPENSYTPVQIVDDFNSAPFNNLRDLIVKMVKFKESDRLGIVEVLNHSFFDSLTKTPIELLITNYEPDHSRLDKINEEIRKIIYSSQKRTSINRLDLNNLHSLSVSIYQRITDLIPSNIDITKHNIYLATACWISSKIVMGTPPRMKTEFRTREIIECEREVCHYLSYILPIIDTRTLELFNFE